MNCKIYTLHKYNCLKFYGKANIQRSYRVLKWVLDNGLGYDKIIYHDYQGIGFFLSRAKKCGMIKNIDLICNIHGNHCLSGYFGKKTLSDEDLFTFFMERKSAEDSDYVISPSQYYLDWYSKYININKKFVIQNIPFVCDTLTYNLESKTNVLKLGFIGRLEVLKGIFLICDALNELSEQYTIDILFIGKPTDINGQSATDCIKNALNKNIVVTFLHNKNTTEAIKIFKQSRRLVIHASFGETSSKVVEEMISNNVYVIASNLPGTMELIKNEYHNKILFKNGSKESLKNKIIEFYKNPIYSELIFDSNLVETKWIDVLNKDNIIYEYSDYNPLVSVIIPTKNRTKIIDTSIKSILNQTYKNIEIIVSDDNTTDVDKLSEICENNNVKLIKNNENLYKGKNCNNAVKYASGELLLFFDDDDIATNHMIEKYIDAYRIQKYDIMSCFANVFEQECIPLYESLAVGNCIEANINDNMFGKGTFIVKKDKFIEINGYFEDICAIPGVDFRFYLKSSLNNLNIQVYPSSLYFYRKNSENSIFYTATTELKNESKKKIADMVNDHYHKIDAFYLLPNSINKYQYKNVHFMFRQKNAKKITRTISWSYHR